MLEIAITAVVTALVMLLPLRAVNIRRLRAWASRDASVAAQVRADEVFAGAFAEAERMRAQLADELEQEHEETLDMLNGQHEATLAEQRQEYALSFQTSRIERESRDLHIANLEGEINGLTSAHEEAKVWADRILRDHEWHVGGKANPHGKGVEIQWGCANCPAVVFAPEGSL